jgi:hypothetical protein
VVSGSLAEETDRAIAAADLSDSDAGAVEAIRILARKIDAEAELREAYIAWQRDRGEERPKPLQLDNVSIPAYLKYAESLGLTPAGRSRLIEKRKETAGGSLAQRRAKHLKSA